MKLKFFSLLMLLASITTIAVAKKKPKEYNAIVYSTSNVRYKGFIEKVTDKGITIDYFGTSKFISTDSISKIKVKKSNALSQSFLIGSAGGLLAGSGLFVYEVLEGNVSGAAAPVIVIGTALVSAGIGAIINTRTSVKKYKNLNEAGMFKKIQLELSHYSEAYLSKDKNVNGLNSL